MFTLILLGTVCQILATLIPAVWTLHRRNRAATWGNIERPASPPVFVPLALAVVGILIVTSVTLMS